MYKDHLVKGIGFFLLFFLLAMGHVQYMIQNSNNMSLYINWDTDMHKKIACYCRTFYFPIMFSFSIAIIVMKIKSNMLTAVFTTCLAVLWSTRTTWSHHEWLKQWQLLSPGNTDLRQWSALCIRSWGLICKLQAFSTMERDGGNLIVSSSVERVFFFPTLF